MWPPCFFTVAFIPWHREEGQNKGQVAPGPQKETLCQSGMANRVEEQSGEGAEHWHSLLAALGPGHLPTCCLSRLHERLSYPESLAGMRDMCWKGGERKEGEKDQHL